MFEKIKNIFKRKFDEQKYILRSDVNNELSKAYKRGENAERIRSNEKIDKLIKENDQKNEIINIRHKAEIEEMSEIIRNMKKRNSYIENREYETDLRIEKESKTISKFVRDFKEAHEKLSCYLGNFHMAETDIKKLEK